MARLGFGKRFPARDSAVARALASNVKRLRLAKGLTQDTLAADAKIEQQALSLIENGRANPTLITVEGIAAALGVDFLELFAAPPKTRRAKDR